MSSATKKTIMRHLNATYILLLLLLLSLALCVPNVVTMVKTKEQNAQEMTFLYKEMFRLHDGSMIPTENYEWEKRR